MKRPKVTFISIHIIANQNSYHDDKSTLRCFTCVFCSRLIRNMRSRRQFFYYHPSGKFRYTVGEIVKKWCQELDIYIYIYLYIYTCITLSVIDMDFLYQFNMKLHHFSVLFTMFKKCFALVGRSFFTLNPVNCPIFMCILWYENDCNGDLEIKQ